MLKDLPNRSQHISQITELGYLFGMSGAFSAIWYVLASAVVGWEQFNIAILLGFIGIAALGLGICLLSDASLTTLVREVNRSTMFILTGMTWIALGLGAFQVIPGMTSNFLYWLLAMGAALILIIYGLLLVVTNKPKYKEMPQGSETKNGK